MTRSVAIACQGGGSHTAFTAGALQRLLPLDGEEISLVGLSGTSGGAVCAALAWTGLAVPDQAPAALLGEFWNDLGARGLDRWVNDAIVGGAQLRVMGFPLPQFSPYQTPAAAIARQQFQTFLTDHIDFEAAREHAADGPALLISAIDVESGHFHIFREDELSPAVILASAAEPALFGAVEVDGRHYWDGMFSKNPPLKDFSLQKDIPDPDEVWVIQINPQSRDRVPKSPHGIADRRNELSGNTALNQEVRFIEQVNEWVDAGYLPAEYTRTAVRRIRFHRDLHWSSKLDRSPAFLESLFRDGRAAAAAFCRDLGY